MQLIISLFKSLYLDFVKCNLSINDCISEEDENNLVSHVLTRPEFQFNT